MEPEEFNLRIQEEMSSYEKALAVKGSSASVIFDEDSDITISTTELSKLLEFYANGGLGSSVLEYIGDALELGERVEFENDHHREIVFEFCNPEINGKFSISRASEVMRELKA